MSLRDKLIEILPGLLPLREEEAIKGTELIAKVRAVLGDTYSDHSLRSQFSFIALEPDSCLARVANGQGYYLRQEEPAPSLQHMFESELNATRSGNAPQHKALALAVRLYDTAGMGVFVFPPEPESWEHPDLVAVHWPAGCTDANGAYVFTEEAAAEEAHLRAVCVETATDAESCRKAFFRTLACSAGAQQAELLLIGPEPEATPELSQLAAMYGVGIRYICADPDTLEELPRADEIFRAATPEAAELLAAFAPVTLAHTRHKHLNLTAEHMPAMAAARQWAHSCLSKGRVEAYESRVAVN